MSKQFSSADLGLNLFEKSAADDLITIITSKENTNQKLERITILFDGLPKDKIPGSLTELVADPKKIINGWNLKGQNPMSEAGKLIAKDGLDFRILELLLAKGGRKDATDAQGKTALVSAVMAGSVRNVTLLVKPDGAVDKGGKRQYSLFPPTQVDFDQIIKGCKYDKSTKEKIKQLIADGRKLSESKEEPKQAGKAKSEDDLLKAALAASKLDVAMEKLTVSPTEQKDFDLAMSRSLAASERERAEGEAEYAEALFAPAPVQDVLGLEDLFGAAPAPPSSVKPQSASRAARSVRAQDPDDETRDI